MNKTERLILESLIVLLKGYDWKREEMAFKIEEALAPKEDDGLAEQRDKDLDEGSLPANKKKVKK